jgi:hypothetical protein
VIGWLFGWLVFGRSVGRLVGDRLIGLFMGGSTRTATCENLRAIQFSLVRRLIFGIDWTEHLRSNIPTNLGHSSCAAKLCSSNSNRSIRVAIITILLDF